MLIFFGNKDNVILVRELSQNEFGASHDFFYLGRQKSQEDTYPIVRNCVIEVCNDLLKKGKNNLLYRTNFDVSFLDMPYFEDDVKYHSIHSRVFEELRFCPINDLKGIIGYSKSKPIEELVYRSGFSS